VRILLITGRSRSAAIGRAAGFSNECGWKRILREGHLPHSIINEPYKLLNRIAFAAVPQILTVIFAVNLSGTSIGAGFRAVLRKRTFRDLSRSIDSWGARERFIATRPDLRIAPELKMHQTP
jgi:hypothetical protein